MTKTSKSSAKIRRRQLQKSRGVLSLPVLHLFGPANLEKATVFVGMFGGLILGGGVGCRNDLLLANGPGEE